MLEENLRINEPGLNVLPPGVERYVVNGGGLTGVQVFPNDEIERLCLHATAINLDIGKNKIKSVTACLPDDIRSTFLFFGFNADQALKIAAHPDCFKET